MNYGRSKVLKSPKIIKKQREKKIKLAVLYFFAVILFLIALIFILRLSFLQISNVKISGDISDQASNQENIKQKALSVLTGNYLYFIPKTSFFFFSKSAISENILNNFKKHKKNLIRKPSREGEKNIYIYIYI